MYRYVWYYHYSYSTAYFQYLAEAKHNNMSVKFKHIKIVLSGSSAAGKSSFCHLLFRCDFSEEYNSTDVMEARQGLSVIKKTSDALSVKSFSVVQRESEMMWLELDSENRFKHFNSLLSSMFKHNNAMIDSAKVKEHPLSSSIPEQGEKSIKHFSK